ncbi:MAG: CRISPR-associated endonuclease Cas2 [Planctomycetes bacterium]|nr:CRISPR-associated endonuclease Cas2 [Planctomycetota bacterium]
MHVLVTYDVSTITPAGRRRLRRVAQACLNYGQRVQYSVFECQVGETEMVRLRQELLAEINAHEDSLRIYQLGEEAGPKVEHYGQKPSQTFEAALVV